MVELPKNRHFWTKLRIILLHRTAFMEFYLFIFLRTNLIVNELVLNKMRN